MKPATEPVLKWFTCKIVTPSGYVSAYASILNASERGALMAMRRQFRFTYLDHAFIVASKEA